MRHKTLGAMLVAGLALLAAVITQSSRAGDTSQPAATQPGFSVHGKIKIGANIDLTGPNYSRVVIYVDSDPVLDAASSAPAHATVAQRNKTFVPNFIVVPRNTEVEFPNWDHYSHNVFSRSAGSAPAFDLDRYPYGQSKTRKFDKVGVVQVFCNVHPSMKALIVVTPNMYFTHPDADGNFELKNLPAGQYQLTTWEERCASRHQDVTVGPGLDPQITFTLDEDRNSILENDPPKHSRSYGVERGLGIKREKLNLPVVEESHPAPTTEPCDDCK